MLANDHDPRIAALSTWNDLARENTENAIVSSMFEAMFKASESIETFSTWLLVGTAAISAFFITNADKLLPYIGRIGFLLCGLYLCLSGFLGLVSRLYALRCKIQMDTGAAIRKTFAEHISKYDEEEAKINASAKSCGISLETGIRIDRVMKEFLAPMPKWVVWFVNRSMKKDAGNPQIGFLSPVSQ